MLKTAFYFVKELGYRLGQHPVRALGKVFNGNTWRKLTQLAVGETVQSRYLPKLPKEMVQVLEDTGSTVNLASKIEGFLNSRGRLNLPQSEQPEVSIIVPVYNQFLSTLYCLESIVRFSEGVSYEVILADDCSTDETVQWVRFVEGLRVSRPASNLGFLRNCNHAVAIARGKFLVFLNNDTYVQPDWLRELLDTIQQDSSVGIVGSKLVYPDGSLQEAGGILWNDGTGANYGRDDNPTKPQYNFARDVDYVSGASLLIPLDLFKRLGGFDERYVPAYFEDSDMAFAVRRLGFKVRYQPWSVVVHFEGVSHGKDEKTGIKQHQVTNRHRFAEKWSAELRDTHFRPDEDWFHARERKEFRGTILVVDRRVPTFDRDAGGRNTWQYVVLLNKLGYKVIFLPADFEEMEPYVRTLQKLGVEVLYGAWFKNNIQFWLKENLKNIDFAFLNRPEPTQKFLSVLKEDPKIKIVYHGHDLHYLRLQRQFALTQDTKVHRASQRWETLERKLIDQAHVVFTVSRDEKEILDRWTSDPNKTKILPFNYFEPKQLHQELRPYDGRSGLLFVGGMSHEPNVDAVLWFVNEVLPLLPESLVLTIVGSDAPERIRVLASPRVKLLENLSDGELGEVYANTLIAIAPLRFGAGIKGKTIEAFFHGVPLVGTPVAYEGLGLDLSRFPVVNLPAEFARMISYIGGSEAVWQSFAAVGRDVLKQDFTKEKVVCLIDTVFPEEGRRWPQSQE
jgi:GT2 family glycosyltransferase